MKLIARHGQLYYDRNDIHAEDLRDTDHDPLLLCIYPEGDCDTISWPAPNVVNLRRALYDGRECGFTGPNDTHVTLPDGTPFEF